METIATTRDVTTTVSYEDRILILRILDRLGPHVQIRPLGTYRQMTPAEVWLKLVGQVCVMGSSRGMAAIGSDSKKKARFAKAISLRAWAKSGCPESALAKVLKEFSATRFANRAAKLLRTVAKSPKVVQSDRCVLLRGLDHEHGRDELRATLIERCPIFKLKSASDFMINVGLSHDVVALDIRVVGALQKLLGFNMPASKVQARDRVYLSVEGALREVCEEAGTTLAVLDRAIFQFGGMSALDFAVGIRPRWRARRSASSVHLELEPQRPRWPPG